MYFSPSTMLVIRGRYRAGETLAELARDYDATEPDIRRILGLPLPPGGPMRPSNQELYEKSPEIGDGTQGAVAAAQAAHPGYDRVLEAKPLTTDGTVTGYEVTLGKTDGTTYTILEVKLGTDLNVQSAEERPNVPPGQEKEHQGQGKKF
jgi:hypothetical protein